jgi:N-acetylglucosaminyldiphosphoundecaprenol N-acetyl-beta-D-mannosaminyltransferase
MTEDVTQSVQRCDILGVGVHALNIPLALACIERAILTRRKGYICATPVHSIMVAQDDSRYRDVLNGAFLCTPDGMPLVWLGRFRGHKAMERVYGPDLMRAVLAMSEEAGWTHYFYGSDTGTLDALERRLKCMYPKIRIVGKHSPPFRPLTESEWKGVQADVAAVAPDFVWVGIGAPKQDLFMAEHISRLDTTMMVGVGAAFDFLAGQIVEAPAWMQRIGLQWLHRMVKEPRRLWRRYLINNPRFVFSVIRQQLGFGTRAIPDAQTSGECGDGPA